MPCKHHKDALIEVAAGGTEPQGDLRAHLAGCIDCRAAFEQERSLFASIDAGLHVAANAEVPASLLPRVRARLDEEAAPRRIWVTNWFVLASAALIVIAFLAARSVLRPNVVRQPEEAAAKSSVPSLPAPQSQGLHPVLEPPVENKGATTHQILAAKSHSEPKSLLKRNTTPEVLVSHDQELLLAQYAEQWSLRKHPLLQAREVDATILSPLQVAPIQIAELGVKPLAEEKSQ